MRKLGVICLAVFILLCALPVSAADLPQSTAITDSCKTLDAQMSFLGTQQLASNINAAIVYETNTDTLMYSYNADAQVSPASLLKILTALIAIEKGNMDEVVTVRADVLQTLAADAAVVELVADEVLSVKDLLYCMMVGSGNDAAVVLADHVMGNQQAFVEEMNRYAQALGCTGTNFTNVHGLHDDQQYTTARDVARILAKAIQNQQFCEVFGATHYTVPQTNKADARKLASQNYLINDDSGITYFDERVTGSRTAVNNDQTRSIASVAKANDMNLICVVIGSKSQYEKDGYTPKVIGGYQETKQLLDMGLTGYKTAQILHPNQVLQQSSVLNGNCDVIMGTRDGAFTIIPENTGYGELIYRYINEVGLSAPIEKGQTLSTLQIWCGAVCIAQTEVYAMNAVAVAGSVFADTEKTGAGVNLLTVLLYLLGAFFVVLLVFFAVLFVMRTTHILKGKRTSRRNRANRRRSR